MNMPVKPNGYRHLAARYSDLAAGVLAPERTPVADAWLGLSMTFVAGATNAGGLLAVGQYTSHMSGIISAAADHAVLGATDLVVAGGGALAAFLFGAATSAILVNWGRLHHAGREYALPLTLEAVLLLAFGLLGSYTRHSSLALGVEVAVLCFIMGLQNATVTKLSGAKIRTTHMTGIVTDIGIELGKLVYSNHRRRGTERPLVLADREKLKLLSYFLGCFFLGGIVGALGFSYAGFIFSVPLALLVFALAGPSALRIAFR
ncbi:YoaK family protein [Ancylobacter sp. SL191]|uniref:YoaK family protein n=1 Tax=Ancylobacter sp. SL191 TaxID=2995166 RepID=UPI0022714051|nr:YoaK family protein [Ancylobacter sp. SL191]WAC28952.1 YoaK family protein [Ancylobacter sp. SL191]